ncbi:MAG: Holliday junction branch migration protein RuvA [Prolixibacteraceae bacterium]|nr:Holliday junction branch migration protein RuvA [Prolixibacteraceae bacterium]MBN2775647.1 Holliday junction branch migration protein RuvA [Prolixibacteraceae bacterium]
MYEFIKGEIIEINPAVVIIEAGGIGYSIKISLNTYSHINTKTSAKIFLHQIVREDAHLLFGFSGEEERELFRSLISVNGVGANTAIMMLSSLSPDEIISAISADNVNALKSIKGIGVKTAQRIIIDLKDKLGKFAETGQILTTPDNTIRNESLSALVMLGFAKKDAEKVLDKILKENPGLTVESVIKHALKRL